MKNKSLVILTALIILSGCSGLNEAMSYNQTTHYVQMPDDKYRVFEKPSENKVMTTTSFGKAASKGFTKGITLGLAGQNTPEELHKAAARKYLDDNGRKNCPIITNGKIILSNQYEFVYKCP